MKMSFAAILTLNWSIFQSQHISCNSSDLMLSIEPSTTLLRNNTRMLTQAKMVERNGKVFSSVLPARFRLRHSTATCPGSTITRARSEEHTSELQSHSD